MYYPSTCLFLFLLRSPATFFQATRRKVMLVEMYMYIRYMYMSYFILFSISFNPEFLYSVSYNSYINWGSLASLDHQSIKFLAWLALLLIFLS